MTEGFKTLLKDLHELMSNIKDSGITLRTESNLPTEKNTATTKDVVPDKMEHRETTEAPKESNNKSSRSGTVSDVSTTSTPSVNIRDPSSKPSKNSGTELKSKSSTGVHAPLHSSSPKNSSPVFDKDRCHEYATELDYPYSDISDVESDFSEDKQERAAGLRYESLKSSKPRYYNVQYKSHTIIHLPVTQYIMYCNYGHLLNQCLSLYMLLMSESMLSLLYIIYIIIF